MEYKVIVGWDRENAVYFVVESDIEGLWLEKPTFEALVDAIKDVAGELLAHNHGTPAPQSLRIYRDIGAPVPLTA
jgi:predicted RNase H-like HicB family nuclease